MKKTVLNLSLAIAMIISLGSCEKVKDALFPGFETSLTDFEITVPVIVNTDVENSLGSTVIDFNLDSIMLANTSGKFGIDNLGSVKVKVIEVEVLNGDAQNNISNFETLKMTLASDQFSSPVTLVNLTIPDVDQKLVINGNDTELKTYLKGSELTYSLAGKARRETTKELQLTVSVTLLVK